MTSKSTPNPFVDFVCPAMSENTVKQFLLRYGRNEHVRTLNTVRRFRQSDPISYDSFKIIIASALRKASIYRINSLFSKSVQLFKYAYEIYIKGYIACGVIVAFKDVERESIWDADYVVNV